MQVSTPVLCPCRGEALVTYQNYRSSPGICKLNCKFTVRRTLTFSLHSVSRGLPYNQLLSGCIAVASQLLNLFLFLLSLPTPAWREKVKNLLLVPLSFSSSYPFLFLFFPSPPPLPILRRPQSLVYWLSYGSTTFQSTQSHSARCTSTQVESILPSHLTFQIDVC